MKQSFVIASGNVITVSGEGPSWSQRRDCHQQSDYFDVSHPIYAIPGFGFQSRHRYRPLMKKYFSSISWPRVYLVFRLLIVPIVLVSFLSPNGSTELLWKIAKRMGRTPPESCPLMTAPFSWWFSSCSSVSSLRPSPLNWPVIRSSPAQALASQCH